MTSKYTVRYLDLYKNLCVKEMIQEYKYKNVMEVPRPLKVVISSTVEEPGNTKAIAKISDDLTTISGQKAVVCNAKKSVASFKLRAGFPVGCKVTLRKAMMYEFMDRLVNIALPRVRDFRGFSSRQFDGAGNFNFGLKEQIVFPEIVYDDIDRIRGMNISIFTSARSDKEALSLMKLLNFPFYA